MKKNIQLNIEHKFALEAELVYLWLKINKISVCNRLNIVHY